MQLKDLGVGLFLLGIAGLILQVVYAVVKDASTPILVRYGLIALFLGLFVMFISIVKERMDELG